MWPLAMSETFLASPLRWGCYWHRMVHVWVLLTSPQRTGWWVPGLLGGPGCRAAVGDGSLQRESNPKSGSKAGKAVQAKQACFLTPLVPSTLPRPAGTGTATRRAAGLCSPRCPRTGSAHQIEAEERGPREGPLTLASFPRLMGNGFSCSRFLSSRPASRGKRMIHTSRLFQGRGEACLPPEPACWPVLGWVGPHAQISPASQSDTDTLPGGWGGFIQGPPEIMHPTQEQAVRSGEEAVVHRI